MLDTETIRRHIQDYEVMKKLNPGNGGSDSLLSVEHRELLLLHLQEKTYRYVKDICAYVKARFSVNYTVSGMTKWLQANEFRYKKPQGVPAKFDAAKQQEFIEFYEELKQV